MTQRNVAGEELDGLVRRTAESVPRARGGAVRTSENWAQSPRLVELASLRHMTPT